MCKNAIKTAFQWLNLAFQNLSNDICNIAHKLQRKIYLLIQWHLTAIQHTNEIFAAFFFLLRNTLQLANPQKYFKCIICLKEKCSFSIKWSLTNALRECIEQRRRIRRIAYEKIANRKKDRNSTYGLLDMASV